MRRSMIAYHPIKNVMVRNILPKDKTDFTKEELTRAILIYEQLLERHEQRRKRNFWFIMGIAWLVVLGDSHSKRIGDKPVVHKNVELVDNNTYNAYVEGLTRWKETPEYIPPLHFIR